MLALHLVAASGLLLAPRTAAVGGARPFAAPRAVAVACTSKTPEEALKEAELKLEQLQETNEAPKSFADLGLPPEAEAPPAVPAVLSYAPPALIAFSLFLVVLNNLGTFGSGPDVDALLELANLQ